MNGYTMKTPRLPFGVAAAALATATLALLVLAPAGRTLDAHPGAAWAATGHTAATVAAAEAVTVIEVVGVREARPLTVTSSGRVQNNHG